MGIVLLLAVLLAGAAVALATRAVALPRLNAAARIGQIKSYGFDGGAVVDDGEASRTRPFEALATRIGRWVASTFISYDEAALRRELFMAGIYNREPTTFTGYRVMCALAVGLLMALWSSSVQAQPIFGVAVVIGGTAAGWI